MVLAIVAPVTAAVVRGLWVGPPGASMDRAGLGVILGSVAAVNLLLLFVWSQR